MEKKNVGIWIRVSTEDQARGESPKIHEERAKHYAEAKGWNVVTIYNLAATSGKSVMQHSEAKRMIQDIRAGNITGLIFSKIARLARNTKQLLEFSDIFRTYNADLISIYENIDTSSPAGRLFYTIISAMAEWEREEIVSRVKAGMYIRAKLGKKLGGQAQFGYQWQGDELILNPEEAPIRKMMYELFLKEKRKKSVARILNEKGFRSRSSKPFHGATIKRWLRDPISKGLRRTNYSQESTVNQSMQLKPKEEWFFHECPAVVTEELWKQVNDLMDEQDKVRKPILNRKVHIFTNYIFCHCGERMNVRSRLTHYKCVNPDCVNKIRRDDMEEAFKSRLTQFLSNKKELETYFKQSEKGLKNKEQELILLKKKSVEIKSQLQNLIELHSKGQIPTDAFGEYHKEPYEQSLQLEENIINLENEILSASLHKDSTSFIIKESKNIYTKWDSYPRDKKREIIETVVDSIIIGTDTIDINLKKLADSSFFDSGNMGDKGATIYLAAFKFAGSLRNYKNT